MQIQALKIYTTKLQEQHDFYTTTLGLKLISKDAISCTFQLGKSTFIIEERKAATPYHFAINIPCNQIEDALQWLKHRVAIVPHETKEIQDFDFWNAKAIYFYDADNNIVELIARNNLKNDSTAAFNSTAFLEISEIGVPSANVKAQYEKIHEAMGIPIFSGQLETFCAIGNDTGLFICIDYNLRDWFPKNDKAFPSEFEATINNTNTIYSVKYENEVLKIS